ncbi:hypothetical protein [Gordonia phthalatica]|uniref:Uncharacterized protein n=1 Tax=Gordonia phthalatica TaxID=1136941 RepID=A0A0N9NA02_9ACTN|nr:hypothetical protein [Gordonia phthalatica]ALG83826.1 hypothetical protein ACH46_04020 [Gordonia phthalatica]
MTTRHRALALGLAAATTAALLVPAPAHASTVAAAADDGVSPWWWMLLLLLPVVVLIVAALRGRDEYDFAAFTPATGPGFPEVTPQRAARLSALASGRESSAAEAIARADALAAAAARPPKPGTRVPSEGGPVPLPIGASRPFRDDRLRAPDGYPIKAVTESGRYYRPSDGEYATVTPDLWFATAPTAEIAGFEPGVAPK